MRICQCLFHSSQPCLHCLPNTWLNEMLDTVSSTSSVTSVTRRRFVILDKVVRNTKLNSLKGYIYRSEKFNGSFLRLPDAWIGF